MKKLKLSEVRKFYLYCLKDIMFWYFDIVFFRNVLGYIYSCIGIYEVYGL